MTAQPQTESAAGSSSQEATERIPLDRPHHSLAVVLVVLSLAVFLYFAGRIWDGSDVQMWIGYVTSILAVLAAQTYLIRAHTGRLRLGSAKPSTTRAIAFGGAIGILIPNVMPAYYAGVDERTVAYMMGCLALAVLISAPIQLHLQVATLQKAQQWEELDVSPDRH